MSRRSALPGAAELFRSTREPGDQARLGRDSARPAPEQAQALTAEASSTQAERLLAEPEGDRPGDAADSEAAVARAAGRVPTGRERHDEKITVYVSVAELMDLERARLTLRGDHGLAVDRGRIVREALAVVLADLEAEGEDSTLVRRLRDR